MKISEIIIINHETFLSENRGCRRSQTEVTAIITQFRPRPLPKLVRNCAEFGLQVKVDHLFFEKKIKMTIIITYNSLQNTVCNHTKRGTLI